LRCLRLLAVVPDHVETLMDPDGLVTKVEPGPIQCELLDLPDVRVNRNGAEARVKRFA
jgi:hypothetical protein